MSHKRLARTSTMDTRKLLEPVITEIPERGRQMSTKHFSKGGDEIGLKGDGKSVCAGTFHEGYVGDKKYLVPDSTLKAMADIVHLKVRKYEEPRSFKLFDASDEEARIKYWQKKKNTMLNKLDDWSLKGDNGQDNANDGWSEEVAVYGKEAEGVDWKEGDKGECEEEEGVHEESEEEVRKGRKGERNAGNVRRHMFFGKK